MVRFIGLELTKLTWSDFSLVLATIITSITNFISASPGTDVNMADVMGSAEMMENQHDDAFDQSGDETVPGVEESSSADTRPAWEQDGGGLVKVLKAFQLLSDDFNAKFHAMWA
jgi:hypothetical protein